MDFSHPLRHLNWLAMLTGTLLAGFAALYGIVSWRAEKTDQIRQMESVLEISQKALDRYLTQQQAAMEELALDIEDAGGSAKLPAVQRLLRRFHDLHPEAAVVTFIGPSGQVLASSLTPKLEGLPDLSVDMPFREFLKAQTPTKKIDLSRPLIGRVSGRWAFPMRLTLRDRAGNITGFIAFSLPVEMLQAFWASAPIVESGSLGLLRDDGYLLSRYPVPGASRPEDVYAVKQTGALFEALAQGGYPARGYVEGFNPLTGVDWANAFKRLDSYPATFFVSMPLSTLRSAWWERVQLTYALMALFTALGAFGYAFTLRRQRAWDMERHRAEQRLRAAEQEERFLIEGISAGVVIYGPNGKVQRCNRLAMKTLGLKQDEAVGRVIIVEGWRLLREDGSEMPPGEYLLPRVLRDQQPLHDIVVGVMRPNAVAPLWLLCNADPELSDKGTLRRVVLSFVDITSRKNAERTLERSESRYRMLYENSLDAVLQTRPHGEILQANPAACAMFGSSEAVLRGRRGDLADRGDPRFAALMAQRDREGRAQGELTLLRNDGTRFEAEITASVYTDEAGEPLCIMVMRDVTDRRRADAAQTAQELAERANRAKSQFVARMSHELRTPLNAILGFSDVLLIDPVRPLEATQREDVQHIHDAGQHLLSMIDDLLDLSQVEAGALRLSLSNVDPFALAQKAVHETRAQAEAAGIALTLDTPRNAMGRVRVDRTRFRQIVLNLLSNAIKYNRPGGRVSVSVQAEGDRLVLTVADSGLGMTPEQVEALYQPFNRLGRESTGIEGTGIGMAITKNLIDVMGGRLVVTSEVDVGTEFRVDLPFLPGDQDAPDTDTIALFPAADSRAETAPRPTLSLREARDMRVLLVEDNAVNQDLAASLLRMVHLPFDVADDGRAAVEKVRRTVYDAVLMDMQMPEMDGLEATRAIRAMPSQARLPIIAMTANAFAGDRAACLAAGMNDHIGKPVRPRDLYKILSRWLGIELQPPAVSPATGATAGLQRVSGLDTERGLAMFGGNGDTYRLAVEHFLSLYGDGLAALDAQVDGRAVDPATLRREVHGLGGAAAAIGALAVEARAQAIDRMLGPVDGPPEAVDMGSWMSALAALRTELAGFVSGLQRAAKP